MRDPRYVELSEIDNLTRINFKTVALQSLRKTILHLNCTKRDESQFLLTLFAMILEIVSYQHLYFSLTFIRIYSCQSNYAHIAHISNGKPVHTLYRANVDLTKKLLRTSIEKKLLGFLCTFSSRWSCKITTKRNTVQPHIHL